VLDSISRKLSLIVLWLIQSDDVCYAEVLEHLEIVFSPVAHFRLTRHWVNRSHKRDKLIGNDPVKVTVIDPFIVLVLPIVKVFKSIPS